MIAKQYTMTSPNFEGEVLFGYNVQGGLVYFEVKCELTEKQQAYLLQRLPLNEPDLKVVFSAAQVTIKLLPPDLTFERFWVKYNYKVDKKTAEKTWNRLKDADKLAALNHVTYYLQHLGTTAQLYPATYLNKRRWEDNK